MATGTAIHLSEPLIFIILIMWLLTIAVEKLVGGLINKNL